MVSIMFIILTHECIFIIIYSVINVLMLTQFLIMITVHVVSFLVQYIYVKNYQMVFINIKGSKVLYNWLYPTHNVIYKLYEILYKICNIYSVIQYFLD